MPARVRMTDEQLEKLEHRFDWPLLIAAALVIPALAIEMGNFAAPWPTIGAIFNWTSWLIFLTESVVMIRAAGWAWVRRNPLPFFVTVVTTPLAPPGLEAARVLRFARLLRLIPGASAARRLFTIEGIRYAATIVVATILFGGLLFAQIEEEQGLPPLDGIWWALSTITTVGYGDTYPMTDAGKVLAIGVMLIGISFAALVTGFAAERFIARGDQFESEHALVKRELGELRHEIDAVQTKLDRLLEGQPEIREHESDDEP